VKYIPITSQDGLDKKITTRARVHVITREKKEKRPRVSVVSRVKSTRRLRDVNA